MNTNKERFNKTAGIILNAPSLDIKPAEDFIICADGGYNVAVGFCFPSLIVGDFGSISVIPDGIEKVVCPAIKDYTDGEKAISVAVERGYKNIVIYGATGGRADQCYANLSLLHYAKTLGAEAIIKSGTESIVYADINDKTVSFTSQPGQTVSVLPYGEKAVVGNSYGLLYPYNNALALTRARAGTGVSNVTVSDKFGFEIKEGAVLIFLQTKKHKK